MSPQRDYPVGMKPLVGLKKDADGPRWPQRASVGFTVKGQVAELPCSGWSMSGTPTR